MLQRLKQSLTEELEQVVGGQKPANDAVSVIERNASLLKTQTPEAGEMEFIKDGADDVSTASPTPVPAADGEQAELLVDGLSKTELEGKLRKFAKYEEKYPQLLKAYRTEKKKGELVKLFEKVLAENTPCQTIADTQQMLDYLDGMNNKSNLLKQELERVSDAHSRLRKRAADSEADLKAKLAEAEAEIENLVAKDSPEDDALRARLETTLAELETAKADLAEAQRVQSELESKAPSDEPTVELEEAKKAATEAQQAVKELQAQAAQAKDLEAENTKIKQQLEELASVKAELSEALKVNETVQELKAQLAETAKARDAAQSQVKELEDQVTRTQSEIEKLNSTASEAAGSAQELSRLHAELANAKKQSEDLAATQKKLNEELAETKKEAKEHDAAQKKWTEELDAAQKDRDAVHKKLEASLGEIKELKSKAPAAGGKKKKKGGVLAPAGQDEALQAELAEKSAALAKAETDLAEAAGREETYKKRITQLESEIEALKDTAESDAKLAEVVNARDEALASLQQAEEKAAQHLQELKAANAAKESAEFELKTATAAKQAAEAELKTATAAKEAAEAELKSAQQAVAAADSRIKAMEDAADAQAGTAGTDLRTAQDAQAAAEAKAQAAEAKAQAAEAKAQAAAESQKAAEAKVSELEAANAQLVQKRAELDKAAQQQKVQLTKHKDDLVAVQAKLKEYEGQKRLVEDLEKKVRAQADVDRRLKVMEGEKTRLERQVATGERTRTSLEKERADLLAQIRGLHGKVTDAEATAKAATAAQDGLRRQVDELGMRVSESAAKIDVLRDELVDAQRLAQERLLETTSMRQMLSERADGHDAALKDARDSVKALSHERDQLEQEVTSMGKRLLRETEQLRSRVNDLSSQLEAAERERARYQDEARELRGKCDGLAKRLEDDQGSSQAVQSEISSLRQQLEASESSSRELSRAHALLKKVSDDTQLRLERLQKAQRSLNDDLETLRQENSQLRRGRSASIVKESGPAKTSEQEEYIKNVILGFLEHKDQRRQLLPVLAMLLKFDGDDEQRFWAAFS